MKAKIRPFKMPYVTSWSLLGLRGGKTKMDPNHKMFYIACTLFIFGVAMGAVFVSLDNMSLLEYLSYLTKNGLETRVSGKVLAIFVNCLIPHLVLMLFCWMFANCTFGMPFILFLIIYKGTGAGLMGGYIYRYYGGAGVLYNLFITMPPALIAAVGFLWLAVYSSKASVTLYAVAIKGTARNIKDVSADVYHYLALAGVAACVSAMLEAVLFKVFGGLFI
jgi:hypothetical protein